MTADAVTPAAPPRVPAARRTGGRPDGDRFRPDIEGLRAVAVLLVVLGHAGVRPFAGGYVGVDVFFVISGYLITALLLRERARTGTVSITAFYARRALRLLPAATVVLLATLAGAWLWLSPVRSTEYAHDAVASATYWINLRLAHAGTDYLAASTPSPFQHFWSLTVEEQFYLVWPALILLTTRRRGGTPGRHQVTDAPPEHAAPERPAPAPARDDSSWYSEQSRLGAVLALLVVTSFVLSVTETARSAPWAYFGAHTRAWELGAGALLALGATRLRRVPARWAAAAVWAGLAAITAAAAGFGDRTAFPGYAVTLPVLGAVLVIAGGTTAPANRLLALRPLQVVGRLSYSWYLWHWPVLLIAPAALGISAGPRTNVLLAAGALGLAALTYHLVEDPVRRRAGLRRPPWRAIALGLALAATGVTAALVAAAVPRAVPVGAAAADLRTDGRNPAGALAAAIDAADPDAAVPANLDPSLARVGGDKPQVYRDGCHLDVDGVVTPARCVYGDPAATVTVALMGDSHAAQWFPALNLIARQRHWRLLPFTKSACSAATVTVYQTTYRRAYTECDTWRRNTVRTLRRLRPALVVVASSLNTGDPYAMRPGADATAIWRAGWDRTFTGLTGTGARVAWIADTPFLDRDAPECLAERPRVGDCGIDRDRALRGPAVRRAVAADAPGLGVTVVDPLPWLCDRFCPVVVGDVLVYRDSHHLTTVYSTLLAPLLRRGLPAL